VQRLCLANGRASGPARPARPASGSARASALRRLTRRRCPSAVSVSERSEFGGATPKQAAQGSRRASGDRHSVSPRRLACGAMRHAAAGTRRTSHRECQPGNHAIDCQTVSCSSALQTTLEQMGRYVVHLRLRIDQQHPRRTARRILPRPARSAAPLPHHEPRRRSRAGHRRAVERRGAAALRPCQRGASWLYTAGPWPRAECQTERISSRFPLTRKYTQ
jgi:hypothetical protein